MGLYTPDHLIILKEIELGYRDNKGVLKEEYRVDVNSLTKEQKEKRKDRFKKTGVAL